MEQFIAIAILACVSVFIVIPLIGYEKGYTSGYWNCWTYGVFKLTLGLILTGVVVGILKLISIAIGWRI